MWQCLPFTCYLRFHAERRFPYVLCLTPIRNVENEVLNSAKESRSHVASPEPSGMCCSQSWTELRPKGLCKGYIYIYICIGNRYSILGQQSFGDSSCVEMDGTSGQFYLRQWNDMFLLSIFFLHPWHHHDIGLLFLLAQWLERLFRWPLWPSLPFGLWCPFTAFLLIYKLWFTS